MSVITVASSTQLSVTTCGWLQNVNAKITRPPDRLAGLLVLRRPGAEPLHLHALRADDGATSPKPPDLVETRRRRRSCSPREAGRGRCGSTPPPPRPPARRRRARSTWLAASAVEAGVSAARTRPPRRVGPRRPQSGRGRA